MEKKRSLEKNEEKFGRIEQKYQFDNENKNKDE